jgi:GT2 family glycosyltransferase
VRRQIDSIKALGIQNFEILIVSSKTPGHESIKWLQFEDKLGTNWITRKKNILAQNAKYENLVLMHDYIGLDKDWATGFEIFGDNWNVALTRVEDFYGRRFYDWASWDSPTYPRYSPIPYSVKDHTSHQFVPGAYWVAKTQFMLDNPLNEELFWGDSEDVEWSLRVREKGLVFNPYSKVRHLKKHRGFKFYRSINNDGLQIRPRPDFLNWEKI